MTDKLELTVVTGFLGSGKTTVVERFLRTPEGRQCGVVVNEFGDVGLDHHLFVHAAEAVELVGGGCMCCARRVDVIRALHELVRASRRAGGIRRAVLETSGLASPGPIVATVLNDPWLKAHVRIAAVIAVVDAASDLSRLGERAEARRQLAGATVVLLSKRDLRGAATISEAQRALGGLIAAGTPVLDAQEPTLDFVGLFAGVDNVRTPRASAFVADEGEAHGEGAGSFVIPVPDRLDWPLFTLWLSALLHAHGDRILRVKGIVRTTGTEDAVIINGVQHLMYPPLHRPVEGVSPFLVFICDGVSHGAINRSFQELLAGVRQEAPEAA